MKATILFALAISISNLHAADIKILPAIPKASDLQKSVSAPQVDCEQCGKESFHFFANPAFSKHPEILNQVKQLKENMKCEKGYRLSNDVSYFISGPEYSPGKIGGNWQQGFFSNGTVSKLYVGVSAYKDLMFVTKVTEGSKVLGYNVTLSFCELKSAAKDLPSIVSNERNLKHFSAPNGIILDRNTHCGYNVVDLAMHTTIVSERNISNEYSPFDVVVPTSYTKPACAEN